MTIIKNINNFLSKFIRHGYFTYKCSSNGMRNYFFGMFCQLLESEASCSGNGKTIMSDYTFGAL